MLYWHNNLSLCCWLVLIKYTIVAIMYHLNTNDCCFYASQRLGCKRCISIIEYKSKDQIRFRATEQMEPLAVHAFSFPNRLLHCWICFHCSDLLHSLQVHVMKQMLWHLRLGSQWIECPDDAGTNEAGSCHRIFHNDGWWFVEVWSDRDGLVVLFWWLIVFADTTHILSLLFCGLVVPWWPIRCRRQLANEACCDAGQYWTWFQTNRLIDCIDSMVRSSSNPHCFLYCKHRLSGFCRSMQHWILHAVAKA